MKGMLFERGIIDDSTQIIISHFSHNSNPTREHLKKIEERYGVTAAYDGYEIRI